MADIGKDEWLARKKVFDHWFKQEERLRGVNILSIDPGLEGGYAVWPLEEWRKKLPPSQVGLLIPRIGVDCDWFDRLATVQSIVRQLLRTYLVVAVFCEWPCFFDNASGATVAITGSLAKLTSAAAVVATATLDANALYIPVPVIIWKGNMPKLMVNRRIKMILGSACRHFSTHVWDAVGIGLFAKGVF